MSKICPLLTIASSGLPVPEGKKPCEENGCALWIDEYVIPINGVNTIIPGKCAIKEIGSSLESVHLDGVTQY